MLDECKFSPSCRNVVSTRCIDQIRKKRRVPRGQQRKEERRLPISWHDRSFLYSCVIYFPFLSSLQLEAQGSTWYTMDTIITVFRRLHHQTPETSLHVSHRFHCRMWTGIKLEIALSTRCIDPNLRNDEPTISNSQTCKTYKSPLVASLIHVIWSRENLYAGSSDARTNCSMMALTVVHNPSCSISYPSRFNSASTVDQTIATKKPTLADFMTTYNARD